MDLGVNLPPFWLHFPGPGILGRLEGVSGGLGTSEGRSVACKGCPGGGLESSWAYFDTQQRGDAEVPRGIQSGKAPFRRRSGALTPLETPSFLLWRLSRHRLAGKPASGIERNIFTGFSSY